MKKLKLLFLLFLITAAGALKAQQKDSYIATLSDSVHWTEVSVPEFDAYLLEYYSIYEKQIYNDTVYYFINGSWFIEDTTNRMIYRINNANIQNPSYALMYNFSLEVGDSILLGLWTAEYWTKVDSIGSFETLDGIDRKVWYLHFCDDPPDQQCEYPVWVEGLGSLAGFRKTSQEPRLDWWGWGILNCWYNADTLIYKSDFAEQWGCELEYMDLKEKNTQNVRLYPNPIQSISYLEFDNIDCSEITLDIYNVLGQKIYSQKTNTNYFEIYANRYSIGQYIYTVSDSQKLIFTGRFIIEH